MVVGCSLQHKDGENSNLTNNYVNRIEYSIDRKCISYLRCSDQCYFDGLQLDGNRLLKSSEIQNIFSDYILFMDTIQIYNVDSQLDSIGRIFISNPLNGNRIKFECYPLNHSYQITEAVILDSDIKFQGGIQIRMPKIEFYNTIKHISFSKNGKLFSLENQWLCDTLNIQGDSDDTCQFVFSGEKLIKISYKMWHILE